MAAGRKKKRERHVVFRQPYDRQASAWAEDGRLGSFRETEGEDTEYLEKHSKTLATI